MSREHLQQGAKWIGVGAGAAVPAYGYFTSYTPPLFPGISLITAAIAAAILLIAGAWRQQPQRLRDKLPPFMRRAAWLIASSVVLLVLYALAFQFTTAAVPSSSDRLQIGWGMADWSLTSAGKRWKQTRPAATPGEVLKWEAAFTQDRVQIIWTATSVYLVGAGLIVTYFLTFAMWSLGFALLSTQPTAYGQRRTEAQRVRPPGGGGS